MNKLLQTTLIATILSTGAMAGETTGALPKTIESGATVYVNKDIALGGLEPVTIDNYGAIDTEVTSAPYPKITGVDETEYGRGITTINNHVGRSVKEETDEPTETTIKEANTIKNVTLEKVYKIVDEGGGTVDENLQLENVKIAEVYDAELSVESLATYTANDILFLGAEGADRTVRIRGTAGAFDSNDVLCNLGDLGSDHSYSLEFVNYSDLRGSISNYKSGSITVKKDGDNETILYVREVPKQELYVPLTVTSGMVIFYGNADIYSVINVSNDGRLDFGDTTNTLKTGATLRIGEAPTTTTGE